MKPVDVREKLLEALRLDLVGPDKGSDLEDETLPQAPSRWYLTGFLVPLEADEAQRSDETSGEEIDEIEAAQGANDDETPEPASAKRAFFSSSIGISVLVPEEEREAAVTALWGDYEPVFSDDGEGEDGEKIENGAAETEENTTEGDEEIEENGIGDEDGGEEGRRRFIRSWQRSQRDELVTIKLPHETKQPVEYDVPNSDGLKLVVTVRPVLGGALKGNFVPKGTRAVSLFLVNKRRPADDDVRDTAFAFQVHLDLKVEAPLIPRPNLRGLESDDWDEKVADLQYRDIFEFVVGHAISTEAIQDGGQCRQVRTRWIPSAEVERVAPATIEGVELEMDTLATLQDGSDAQEKLGALVTQYRLWIDGQKASTPKGNKNREDTADELLRRAGIAADRIEAGITLLNDPEVLDAFRIANKVMAAAARQRFGVMQDKDPASITPAWRPFQLAFVLINLRGIVEPKHNDREVVDLLFFPTGGGKTEAYLGLAAFTLVLRRLRNPGISSAGLCVLMRYTLRLLTLDQLSRAATLICALELERQKDTEKFGEWPFEIGLWVGSAATPNRMGSKGDNNSYSARAKTIAYKNDNRKPSPIPLEECPWCGSKFTRNSFQLKPGPDNPTDLRIICANRHCVFTRDQSLPILSVDDPIYRRLPCFMIATVDKFASLPWVGQAGALLGGAERHDAAGFYGASEPGKGTRLAAPLPPPDLVIQDELHLISGPLGTMAGLYEAAIEALCVREMDGRAVRPKIVASTATVRHAERQILDGLDVHVHQRAIRVRPEPPFDFLEGRIAAQSLRGRRGQVRQQQVGRVFAQGPVQTRSFTK